MNKTIKNQFIYLNTFKINSLDNSNNSNEHSINFTSNYLNTITIEDMKRSSAQEFKNEYRFQRAANPNFKYEFKIGNYFSDDSKKKFDHLFLTMDSITMGIRYNT